MPNRASAGTAKELVKQINRTTRALLEISDEVTACAIRFDARGCVVEPEIPITADMITADSYEDYYTEARESRAYNIRFLDGALVQMSYRFDGSQLVTHRLAYLPDPLLVPFDMDPESYIQGLPYVEVVGAQRVIVPVRFDYDDRPGVPSDMHHPVSHLTLGQYQNCRIPVMSAVLPAVFLEFIASSFYKSPTGLWSLRDPNDAKLSGVSLTTAESGCLHLAHGCKHT